MRIKILSLALFCAAFVSAQKEEPYRALLHLASDQTTTNSSCPTVYTNNEVAITKYSIRFYGTPMDFHYPSQGRFMLLNTNESTVDETWDKLAKGALDDLVEECLATRETYQLCDWAYLQMLKQLSEAVYGKTNEAVFLHAFLYSQSGYAMRLAEIDDKLFLLVGSNYAISEFIRLDGLYYSVIGESDKPSFHVFGRTNENAKPLDMRIKREQLFGNTLKQMPARTSFRSLTASCSTLSVAIISASCSINTDLIDFYKTYPMGMLGENNINNYAVFANAPIDRSVRQTLYPALRESINGLSETEAVSALLFWVQTAFAYEYDSVVWGEEKTFFPAETMFYPYADCEDRSIFFARIIKDLIGLDVVLLSSNQHISTAVCLHQDVSGDYLEFNNKKYVVCDPAYINAPIGQSMSFMQHTQLQVLPIE